MYKCTKKQKDNIDKLTKSGFFNNPLNCCAAEGWKELGRERLCFITNIFLRDSKL